VLVVDDGSTDESGSTASRLPGVEVLRHEVNEGYGKSLMDAFAYALEGDFDVLVTIDCDEQHEPALIPRFIELAGEHDIVSGTRYAPDSEVLGETPADRAEINRTVTGRINDVTGYALTDAFCGFKAYRRRALSRLRPTEWGYAMPLQLWIQAARSRLDVIELPVPRIYHDADRSFGHDLDSKERRLEYYLRVIDDELSGFRAVSS